MKGGLVASLLAIHALREAAPTLRGDVLFESVIEEECTGNGTLGARLRSPRVDGVVIAEPTDQTAWIATAGVIWFDVAVAGRAAYVGRGSEAVNAVDRAADLIIGLRSLVDDVNRDVRNEAFRVLERPFTLNVGVIEGGDWPSSVPIDCAFRCRLAFPPHWAVTDAQRLVEDRIAELAATDAWLAAHPPRVTYPGFRARGWQIDGEARLVSLLDACHRATVGSELVRQAFTGTADARYFDASSGEQVVFYGPLGGGQHAPDEWVDIDSMASVAKTLCLVAMSWCA